ncbi:hypothetical protein [Ekhidna sp.]
MKKFKNYSLIALLGSLLFMFSCGGDEEEIFGGDPDPDPTSEFDARLNSADTDSLSAEVFLTEVDDNNIDVFITFSSDDATMRRLYATVDEFGQGEEVYEFTFSADKKADGSLELDGAQGEGFAVNLDIPTTGLNAMDGEDIVYKFWTTTGKGDIRDVEKRQATPPMTLTIQLSGDNPNAPLISVSDVQLFAPTADLMSESFVSTADGMVYELEEFESSDLWDIGYTAQGNEPQLSSAAGSPQMFFDENQELITLEELVESNLTEEELADFDLNTVYFVDITDDFDFDGATTTSSLSAISLTPTSSNDQTLPIPIDADGDLIAFLDQYGKIGVIRIDALVDVNGDGEYFDASDYVQIDIKVQR